MVILTACRQNAVMEAPPPFRHAARPDVVGCYSTAFTKPVTAEQSAFIQPVAAFELLRDQPPPPRRVGEHLALLPAKADSQRLYIRNWFADSLTDSVRLYGGDGFGTIAVVFVPDESSRPNGRLFSHGDLADNANPVGSVNVSRIPCDGLQLSPGTGK